MLHKLSIEDENRLRQAIDERSEIKARLALNWACTLANLAEHISSRRRTELHGPEIDMFWIRLYGVLKELTEYYERACELISDPDVVEIYRRCRAIRAQLAEDELLYTEYKRDSVAHIWQDSYELRVKNLKKGTLAEERRSSLLDKKITIEQWEQRLRDLVRKYDVDEIAIAVDFSRRLSPQLRSLVTALIRLY